MTPEERKFRLEQLEQAETYLDEALKQGQVPKRVYQQSQLLLAHDYLLKLDHVPRGSEAVRRCEPKYFDEELQEDMAKDPEFDRAVREVAEKLVELGLIDTVPMPKFTQPLAKA